MLPFVFLVTCWYWNRIVKLARQSNMLERMLLALGISAILLNRTQNDKYHANNVI